MNFTNLGRRVLGASSPPDRGADKSAPDRHFVTWTDEDDEILREAVRLHGTDKWSVIAGLFSNKTSRQCRRRWSTYLSTACKKGGWSPQEDQLLLEAHRKYGNRWTEIAKVVPGRTDNAVKNRFCALCKKQTRDIDVSSSQSSGDMSADDRGTNQKRRVLRQSNNVANKKNRAGQYDLPFRDPHHHWTTDELSLVQRAHPLRRTVIQGGMAAKGIHHIPLKDIHNSKSLGFQCLSDLGQKNVFDDDLASKQVESCGSKIQHWIQTEGTWKASDWLSVQEIDMCQQRGTGISGCVVPLISLEHVNGKENYQHLHYISAERHFISSLPVLHDLSKLKHYQVMESPTFVPNNEECQEHREDFDSLDHNSSGGQLDTSGFQNKHLSSMQIDGSMHVQESLCSPDKEFKLTSMEEKKLTRNADGVSIGAKHQGITDSLEISEIKEDESPLPSSSIGDGSSPTNIMPCIQFLIDGMPSPQFSDSEKQFLLSTLDISCIDSRSVSCASSPFCRTSLSNRLNGSPEISYNTASGPVSLEH
eukprot:c17536_g1_i1 orf=276-1871(-)